MIVEPTAIATRSDLPRDEAAVPRVPVEQAKAALDSGAAIIVDVRAAQSYALEHIAGSISIPLSEIETNPTGLKLKKNQWIITYCT
jgi:rhodanese-related sulfurtransferase